MADRRTLLKRDGQVKLIKEMVTKGRSIVEDDSRAKKPKKEIIALVKNVRSKKISIDELNENILNTVEEEAMEDEMRQSTELDVMIDTDLEILEEYLAALNLGKSESELIGIPEELEGTESEFSYSQRSSSVTESQKSHASQQPTRRTRPRVRLPDIGVKSFSGDPTMWPEFFDTYNVAIHQNSDLSDIERFTYLKGYLHGEARRCIQGLTLSDANYKEAVTLLKNRFGNKKLIISRHMEALLDLEKVGSSLMVKELRSLYDKVMVNIRALQAYDIKSEQFGPMLAPVILKKLPIEIKLEVNRRLKKKDWLIDEMLEILRAEIETQETCAWSQDEEMRSKLPTYKKNFRSTTDTLYASGFQTKREPKCSFCNGAMVHIIQINVL